MIKKALYILIFTIGFSFIGKAQIIRSQISFWSQTFSATSLDDVEEAGSDLSSTLTSAVGVTRLDIAGIATSRNWKVTVSKQDISWPVSFQPSVRRDDDGTPCMGCIGITSVNGGYQLISDIETDFMFGSGTVNDINLQFQVSGISLSVQAADYQTVIVFTLYGEP